MLGLTDNAVLAATGSPLMRRLLTFIPLLVAVAILASAAPAAARGKIALGIADPASDFDPAVIDAHVNAVGVRPGIWAVWNNWGTNPSGNAHPCTPWAGAYCAFPAQQVRAIHDRGIDAIVWWQPVGPNDSFSRYKAIKNGQHDAYIRQWARDAKAAAKRSGRPVFIRFAHESGGFWFPWSVKKLDNSIKSYKKAWRHIYKIFGQEGARKHVRFVWSQVYPRAKWYPGDKYVDYVGITILNFGATRGKWRTMAKQTNAKVKSSLKFTRKPIMLNEVASDWLGGNKARWIRNGYMKAYKQHKKVKAIMYLDTNVPSQQNPQDQPDWRLTLPPDGSALAAYREVAAQGKFQGRLK